jgi:preprotein translocase subunit SecA
MLNIFTKVFGSSNDRVIKAMMWHVNVANDLEEELSKKPDI